MVYGARPLSVAHRIEERGITGVMIVRGRVFESDDDSIVSEPRRRAIAVAPLEPGQTLGDGRFIVQQRLGAGAMGLVNSVLDNDRGESVALKTLQTQDASSEYVLKQGFAPLATWYIHTSFVCTSYL